MPPIADNNNVYTFMYPQVVSPYEVTFMDSFTWRSLCKIDITDAEVKSPFKLLPFLITPQVRHFKI